MSELKKASNTETAEGYLFFEWWWAIIFKDCLFLYDQKVGVRMSKSVPLVLPAPHFLAWFVETTKSLFNESIKEASDTPDSSLPRLIVIIMR